MKNKRGKLFCVWGIAIGMLLMHACKSAKDEMYQAWSSVVVEEVRHNVLPFWENYAAAPGGGFYGRVGRDGSPVADAPRGGVLNARILWSFAAAYRTFGDESYKNWAERAKEYFVETFIDRRYGGVYWLVNENGEVVNGDKYTYALTYGIYGLVEYYHATGDKTGLNEAISLYHTLEQKAVDPQHDGYIEQFTQNWQRLDAYENNAAKTFNAHLHVLEAYTELYRCWKDKMLENRLRNCFRLIMNRMYDTRRKHFKLYFDDSWNSLVSVDSYGHDIEAGWLLCRAADVLDDEKLQTVARKTATDVTDVCLKEGLTPEGYLIYERKEGKYVDRSSWWGQIETIIGCLNVWEISGNTAYMETVQKVWQSIETRFVDKEYGEWFSDCINGEPIIDGDKVSMWRCPYHTTRLAVEVFNRLKKK